MRSIAVWAVGLLVGSGVAFQPRSLQPRRVVVVVRETATNVDRCRSSITEALSPQELSITSADDDPNGAHISITVVAEAFESLPRVKRQQLVYRAIKEYMNSGAIHAVDELITTAPSEL